jgi:glycosyltransferase involved in cell wall biosynthesis
MVALRAARDLARRADFDIVHHLTWGGVRAPTFMGRLGIPLVIGPIGGGESTPPTLRRGLHLKARLTEYIRELSNRTIAVNPIVREGLMRARLIFVRTTDTARLLTPAMQAKSICFAEISLPASAIGTPRAGAAAAPRLLFVGRLIYWKGAHIAIRTLAELRQLVPHATLTVVGKGPELEKLQAEAARLGVADAITFRPWLAREQLASVYDAHDMFLFPSLHDSSGTVVLEALSRGLPVVCGDSGGPRVMVTPQCGIVVSSAGRNTVQFARAMAEAIAELSHDAARSAALSDGAIARAGQFILGDRVASFYGQVAKTLRPTTGTVKPPPIIRRNGFVPARP